MSSALPSKSVFKARILNTIGICHRELSSYPDALTSHLTALDYISEKVGEDHVLYAETLNLIGMVQF